ncbi:sulfotransferase family protein [Chromobacterium subtsugae]|uniref:sulfotransferase family protein n=1 Tax=Chromobacterium subtsugae TaxID=251747 RepID=UPI000640FD11|nr:sulfotransferase [Chromobacterium subtsugae]
MRKIYLRRVSGVTHGESTRMVRPDDFASDIVAAVDAAAQIEDFGRYLPLCVDWRAERLRYSRWEDASPLSDAPFLYQRQRRQAAMLADIPFERLPELGQAEGMTPTFIFSIGRCGSTLLSRMLAAVGEQAVSEPDALTNIALVDNAEQGRQAAEAGELIVRSCVEALRRACGPSPVIKLRAVCNLAAAAFVRALPNARYVFMFRGREDWVRSYSRAFGDSAAELEALLRQSAQAFQHLRAAGAEPELVWYEDLLADPAAALRRILPHRADLAAFEAPLAEALRADAQQGSILARSTLAARPVADGIVEEFEDLWRQSRPEGLLREAGLARLL